MKGGKGGAPGVCNLYQVSSIRIVEGIILIYWLKLLNTIGIPNSKNRKFLLCCINSFLSYYRREMKQLWLSKMEYKSK
jgi:hypothetical protein